MKSVDDAAAKAIKGVRQIVRLDDAIAVVAEHMGAAEKGLAALVIEWDDGPHAKLNTEDMVGELEKATLNAGAVAQNIGDVDGTMASAATKVEATYQVPFLAHATMEPAAGQLSRVHGAHFAPGPRSVEHRVDSLGQGSRRVIGPRGGAARRIAGARRQVRHETPAAPPMTLKLQAFLPS